MDGKILAQTGAISRYCATLVPELLPSDPFDAARCDAIFEAAEELSSVNPFVNLWKGDVFVEKKRLYLQVPHSTTPRLTTCHATPCHITPSHTTPYRNIPHHTTLDYTTPHHATPHHVMARHTKPDHARQRHVTA